MTNSVPAPILARCSKCGREFITLPAKLPAFDYWGAPGSYPEGQRPQCGGRIELTTEGTALASTESRDA